MHRSSWGVAVLLLATSLIGAASASFVTQTYEFTGADLLKNVYVSGADHSTAAGNGLFDGARLRRDGYDGNGPNASRSYWTSQQSSFQNWAGTTTDRFLRFNLWGLDGNGANWGEDYKANSWVSHTGPTGWTPWTDTWTNAGWGTPPAGYRTEELIGWDANSWNDGLNFQDADLASKTFQFTVQFDTEDMWWGQNTNGAPNHIGGPMTFWFGGTFDNNVSGN